MRANSVGEMGLLEGRARSATVRAASPVEADLIERQVFLDRVSSEPSWRASCSSGMSACGCGTWRTRSPASTPPKAASRPGAAATWSRPPVLEAVPSIVLAATTDGAQFFVGTAPIEIGHLPFTVGREPGEHETASVISCSTSSIPATGA